MKSLLRSLAALLTLAALTFAPTLRAQDWSPIGPYNANYGPVTVTVDGTIYTMSTFAAEANRSTDRGEHWTVLPVPSTGPLMTDTRNALFIMSYQGVVHRSTDRGHTWTALSIDTALSDRPIIALLPTAGGDLYASVQATGEDSVRLHRSTDGGYTWARTAMVHPMATLQGTAADGSIIASMATSLLRSTDHGVTWIVGSDSLDSPLTAFRRSRTGTLIISTINRTLMASTNHGASWETTGTYPDTIGLVRSLAIDSTGALWVGWNDGIRPMLSTNNGRTWTFISTGFPGVPGNIGISSDAVILSTGTEGILRSTNLGLSWEKAHLGLPGLAMSQVVSLTDTSMLAISKSGDIYVGSWQRPTQWARIWTRAYAALYHGVSKTIVMVIRGTAYRTSDLGRTWDTAVYQSFNDATCVDFDRDGSLLVGTLGVWDTDNMGETWTTLDSRFTNRVSAIAVDTAGRVITGTPGGEVWMLDSRGGSFRKAEIGSAIGTVNDIVASPAGELLIATAQNGILRSTDAGWRWDPANTGLTSTGGRTIAVERRGRLVAAMDNGLFLSENHAETWEQLPTSFTVAPLDVDIDYDGMVIVATDRGLFRRNRTISAAPAVASSERSGFTAAPNPARDAIRFTIASSSAAPVDVQVVDPLGRAVVRLSGVPGTVQHVTWKCGDAPAGVYVARAVVDGVPYIQTFALER